MSIAVTVARRLRPGGRIKSSADAYAAHMLSDLNNALTWASTNNVKLLISEFGWRCDDDSYAWARFAEALYGQLVGSTVDTWLCAWIASEQYPAHRMNVYRGTNYYTTGSPVTPLAERTWAGRIVEQHKGSGRGVNLGNMGENGMFGVGPAGDVQPWSNTREVPVFGSGRTVADGVTTASSTTITSASASFAAGDVGALITGGSIPSATQITSVTNSTTAVLSAAPTASASGVSMTITRRGSTYTFGSGQNLHAAPSSDPYAGGKYADGWTYGSAATWAYLASRGVQLVRLPFRMERMVKTIGGALDTTEVSRYTAALDLANANGIKIILDCHNFAAYYLDNGVAGVAVAIGGASFTNTQFADFWTKMVTQFDYHPAIVCWETMNEPNAASSNWTNGTAQAAVTAIRNAGSTKCIATSWPGFAKAQDTGPPPFITDPANNHRYVVHCYFDYQQSNPGAYLNPYGFELAGAKTAGFSGTDTSPTVMPAGVTSAKDTFSRPDIVSIGVSRGAFTNSLGATEDAIPVYWSQGDPAWQDGSGHNNWATSSGQAASNGIVGSREFIVTNKADWTVEVDLPVVGTSGGLWLRGSSNGFTGLIVDLGALYTATATSTYGNPATTAIASWTSPGYASGDTLRAVCAGNTITVYRIRAGVTTQLGTATSTFNNTQTAFGFWNFNSTTTRWANFKLY